MPKKKRSKKKADDFDDEVSGLEDAFKQALKITPKPPGEDIALEKKKRTPSPLEVHARYKVLKKRIRTRLATRFIDDEVGQAAYIANGVYAVAGKYKVRGELLDWDHELRNIDAKSDEKTKLTLIVHLAKRLKVRN